VDLAEAEVRKVSEAEMPFLTGVDDLSGEAAAEAIANCETAAAHAAKTIASTKAFLAKALVDAKSLSARGESVVEGFPALTERLEDAMAKLSETQKDMAARRKGVQQQLVAEKVARAEAAVQQLASALDKFAEDRLDSITSDEAHTVCEELATTEKEASDALATAKDLLTEQQKQVRSSSDARSMAVDASKWQAKLRQLLVEFARLSRESQTREHRFVANKMLKEAPENLNRLEAQVEASHAIAAVLFSNNKAELLEGVRLQGVLGFLRAHMQAEGVTVEALVRQMSDGDTVTAEELAAFLDKLPCVAGADCEGPTGVPGLTGEQAAKALVEAAGSGDVGALSAEGLQGLLRERMSCKTRTVATDSLEGTNEVASVEAGEVVEVLESKTDEHGVVHAECTLLRDGTKAWLVVERPGGEAELAPCASNAGRVESILAFVEGVSERCAEVVGDAEQKAEMCASQAGQQGPLAEARSALLQLKMKANVLALKMEQLRKRVVGAKTALLQKWEAVQAQAQQIQTKVMLEKLMKGAVTAVEVAEEKAARIIDGVKAGRIFKFQKDSKTTSLDSVRGDADEAMQAVLNARVLAGKAQAAHEAHKGRDKMILDAWMQLMKLSTRIASTERKCRMATEVVNTALLQAEQKHTAQAKQAVRAAVRRSGSSCDELFEEHAGGATELEEGQLRALLEALPGLEVDVDKAISTLRAQLPADRGLRRAELMEVVHEFVVVRKGIAMTLEPELEKAQSLRILQAGELLEVLEGPREESVEAPAGTVPSRIHARALRDGSVGWVTMQGNRGTTFLEPTRKPFMLCSAEVSLRESDEAGAPVVATVHDGDLLELLDGPCEAAVDPELLLNGRAASDGEQGWITLRDVDGETSAFLRQGLHVCKIAIAMTDVCDIQSCKIVRKIEVDETLTVLPSGEDQEMTNEQDQTDSRQGVTRRQFRALRDGATGWVTVKGSQGAVYLEASKLHYELGKRIPLHSGRSTSRPSGADAGTDSAEVVRWLEVGEAFEAFGPPEEGPPQAPRVSVRVRSASGGAASGWASWRGGAPAEAPLKPHSPSLPA